MERSSGSGTERMRPRRAFMLMGAAVLVLGGCASGPDPASSASPTGWAGAPTDDASLYRMVLDGRPPSMRLEPGERPDASLVRWVKPDDWAQAQVDCMTEQGFSSSVHQGGVQYPDVPPEQAKSLTIAAYTCAVSFPVDPRIHLPWNREQSERQYRHLVGTVMPCVRSLGVPVEEPPTFEVWYAERTTDSRGWNPYQGIAQFDVAGLARAHDRCPFTAPDLYPDDLKG